MDLTQILRIQMEDGCLQVPLETSCEKIRWEVFQKPASKTLKKSTKFWVHNANSIALLSVEAAEAKWRQNTVCCVGAVGSDIEELNQFLLVFFPSTCINNSSNLNMSKICEYSLVPNKNLFLTLFGNHKNLGKIWGESDPFDINGDSMNVITLFPLQETICVTHPSCVIPEEAKTRLSVVAGVVDRGTKQLVFNKCIYFIFDNDKHFLFL